MYKKSLTPPDDKVIVITGASSGAGRAAALKFASLKCTLVLAARNEHALQEIAAECREYGSKVTVVKTDVTDAYEMHQLGEAAVAFGGKIDVWINNAGVLAVGDLNKTPVVVHTQVVQTNLVGYMHGAHTALAHFKKQKHGILINNISIGGWLPVPYATGYSASKFGIRGFTAALRGELSKFPGIHVCDLYPAFLDTPGVQHAGNYTGTAIRPAPPVYDPMLVAKAMVKLVQHPKPSMMIGRVAPLLKFAQFISPTITRSITAFIMNSYFKHADPSAATNGNLFEPVEYGTSVYGGWNSPADIAVRKKRITTAAIAVLGIAAGFYLLSKKKNA